MQTKAKLLITTMLFLTCCWLIVVSFSAKAHLMVAQHGTLNLVGDDVFMVLSLPVSAFEGIDDDKDNKLSLSEFEKHQSAIAKVVKERIVLRDDSGSRPIHGLLLSPVAPHDSENKLATQLVIMGRYELADAASTLHYHFDLFGQSSDEKSMKITATRKSDKQKIVLQITPSHTDFNLFTQG